MADDVNTSILLTIEARTAAFERALQRITRTTDTTTRRTESAFSRLDRSFANFGKSLLPGLGAIAAALSAREVLAYADAWTAAKNSLAVAGVTGDKQVKVLDRLYDSAQANAAPLGAMADLFGKAAQAGDNLGASQADLLRFTDGVAVSLKVAGTSASKASGALMQLGQLLGSARVQAEEFNSVAEGARPILIAVANGLDAAGGSVNRLKQLVNDGKVSGQQFFQAFLKGLPTVADMAKNSTQTIDQGVTKVGNAFMKYIGQTDESLGASQRLVQGLNALADNFEQTADITLKFASVLAGALVGRSIAGMLASIPMAASAISALVVAMRAGTVTAVGFTAALGPIGLIVGAAVAASLAFGKWGDSISDATRALANQAAPAGEIEGLIRDVAKAQDAYKAAIASTAGAQTTASNSIVADSKREFEAKKSLLEIELKRQQALIAVQQAELGAKSAALKTEIGGKVQTRIDTDRTGFSDPAVGRLVAFDDDITGLEKTQAAINASPITMEIKKVQAELDLTKISAEKLSAALDTTFADSDKKPGAAPSSTKSGSASKKIDEYAAAAKKMAETTAATIAETEAQRALNPAIDDYGHALARAQAQQELLTAAKEAGRKLTPELVADINRLFEAYAQAEVSSKKLAEVQQQAKDAIEFQKDLLSAAMSDVRTALEDGKITWEEWGQIATNVLNKITDVGDCPFIHQLFEGETT